jgi:hypothetical protein
MESIYFVLGLFMIYTIVHFIIISFTKPYNKRTGYEKFVTIFAIFSIACCVFALGE